MSALSPSPIAVPQAALDDLRQRLVATRWPERETVDDWSQGIPLVYTQELCAHWREEYDFGGFIARLNAFPQFRTPLSGDGPDGLAIDFLHVTSPEPGAFPLVLTHGWPGTIV